MLKDLIAHLIKHLVDKPESVQVEQLMQDNKVILNIHVDHDDLKRVIGKEGRIIRSLRGVAYCFNYNDKEVVLDIAE